MEIKFLSGSTGRLVAVFLIVGMFVSCSNQREYLRKLRALEPGDQAQLSDERIEELKAEIKQYEAQVEEAVHAGVQVGTYYKMLGMEYFERDMFSLALDAFLEALKIHPRNHIVAFYAGLSSANLARAVPDQREDLLAQAEDLYLLSLDIQPTYGEALYGLSVLYLFEYDYPEQALTYVQRLIDKEPTNGRALFVKARAELELGDTDAALETYTRIIDTVKDETLRDQARENKRVLLEEVYGE